MTNFLTLDQIANLKEARDSAQEAFNRMMGVGSDTPVTRPSLEDEQLARTKVRVTKKALQDALNIGVASCKCGEKPTVMLQNKKVGNDPVEVIEVRCFNPKCPHPVPEKEMKKFAFSHSEAVALWNREMEKVS